MAAGRWCGGLVAVKIVPHNCALSSLAEVLRESALSTSITHPNVVHSFSPDHSPWSIASFEVIGTVSAHPWNLHISLSQSTVFSSSGKRKDPSKRIHL